MSPPSAFKTPLGRARVVHFHDTGGSFLTPANGEDNRARQPREFGSPPLLKGGIDGGGGGGMDKENINDAANVTDEYGGAMLRRSLFPDLRPTSASSNSEVNNDRGELQRATLKHQQESCQNASESEEPGTETIRSGNIAVSVRFRPSCKDSVLSAASSVWVLGQRIVEERRADLTALKDDDELLRSALRVDDRRGSYALDRVFGQSTLNLDIYLEFAQPMVHAALDGFNSTVLAYGQTTAGKTHTILGSEDDPGLVPLSLQEVFCRLAAETEQQRPTPGRHLVRVSYIEVYRESVIDLLNPSEGSNRLEIVDNPMLGPYVRGARAPVVKTVDEALQILQLGESNRHFGTTAMNHASSRSHCLFQLRIERCSEPQQSTSSTTTTSAKATKNNPPVLLSEQHPNAAVNVACLSIIDLAGSERVSKSKARGARLQEAGSINKSLCALGNVISAINNRAAHIPFRNSKLTRLLPMHCE